ncbi:type II restriction enzyme [Corynebacterium striatum]|uniref:type II restriction enzyme n=1 Tax=Corynebacterium striatum TaxID=43770 RepID=UPI00194FF470|nr:hypothetical protein [Corynebacterium striatum]QRP19972.1 hypothetical protein I6J27_06405 [Corynebacterium striatum]
MDEQLASLCAEFEVPDGQTLGLNDVGWLKVFRDPTVREQLERTGFVVVEAARIKALSSREPRLMAKHDFSAARPWFFREHGLSIMPVRRDAYLIGRFDVYEKFPEHAAPLKSLPIPSGIESLDFKNLTSEAVMLNAAALSGILTDFVGGGQLYPTVTGRMSTLQLPIRLADLNLELDVDRAQMEIDGGFESAERLILVEAKNHISPDFNIRQLYFPYRRFSQALAKEVVPLYVVYSNGVFHLYRYSFPNPADFRSIKLEDSARYVLGGSEVTSSALRAVAHRTQPEPEPRIPFPQADSFARVVSLLEMLPVAKAEIPQRFGFTPRQADYYVNAGRYLGLMEVNDGVVEGTPLTGSRDERNLVLVDALAQRQVFNAVIREVVEQQRALTKAEAQALMEEADLGLTGSTLPRRASTVAAWSQWIWELIAPEQLMLV